MFGTQYYFCRCSTPRTELLWGPNSQCDFYGDVTLPLTVQSRCYCGNVHGVFVHISVRFVYVQNRKSFCHCRTQLRRCKSFKPCWSLAYVKKNVFSLQASRRHDQDSWCRIFFWHNTSNLWYRSVSNSHYWFPFNHCSERCRVMLRTTYNAIIHVTTCNCCIVCYIFLCMRQFCF